MWAKERLREVVCTAQVFSGHLRIPLRHPNSQLILGSNNEYISYSDGVVVTILAGFSLSLLLSPLKVEVKEQQRVSQVCGMQFKCSTCL